ncbi:MAG: RNA polymerase factor sigma-54 [Bacillota bacterium]|nr:RNA polymerase factor sigma-54 [Bacillota bacterium]
MDVSRLQLPKQTQKLCQQQSDSLKILAMNNIELKEFLQAEQMENPMLELYDAGTEADVFAVGSWLLSSGRVSPALPGNDEENLSEIPDRSGDSLSDYLKSQISSSELSPDELKLLCFIIDLVDTDTGFLTIPVKEISYLTNVKIDAVVKCVLYLRSMEPAGVGADSLEQCLLIQAERAGRNDKVLTELIKYYLEDIAERRYKKISDALHLSRQQLLSYVEFIKSLNPRPGRGFGGGEAEYITPDVIVSRACGKWEIFLNDSFVGGAGISRLYKSYIESAQDENVRKYLREKISRAKLIIKSIEQRRNTLQKVSDCILEKQYDFITGAGELKKMSLGDIADELGVHCSTVSRAVKGKYLQTPKGVCSFKYFFIGKTGRSLPETSEAYSAAEAKAALGEIINSENKNSPLSDSALSKELDKRGIALSRRTVSKYRLSLGIPNTAERKCPLI